MLIIGKAQASKQDGAGNADGGRFCRWGDAPKDCPQHSDDKQQGRAEAKCDLPGRQGRAVIVLNRWATMRLADGRQSNPAEIEADQQKAGDQRAGKQITHGHDKRACGPCCLACLAGGVRDGVGEQDQHDGWRDDLAKRAGGGDCAGGKARIIALPDHGRQGDQCHGDDRRAHDAC